MFERLFRRRRYQTFELCEPAIQIGISMSGNFSQLEDLGIVYRTVCPGYITFPAHPLSANMPMVVGLHFKADRLAYIELFRTTEYYRQNDFDVKRSFAELDDALTARFGQPQFRGVLAVESDGSGLNSRWQIDGLRIDHYVFDRFGPEEHLHIYLSKEARK